MKTFKLTVSSPDGNVFDSQAVNLSLRGAAGDLAIMANHTPFVTSVQSGLCRIELESGEKRIGKTEGGLLTVGNNSATLLSSSFVWITEDEL